MTRTKKNENEVTQEVENNETTDKNIVDQKETYEGQVEKPEDKLIKVKALVCLKYNSKYINLGEKFEVTKKDFNELSKRKLIGKLK